MLLKRFLRVITIAISLGSIGFSAGAATVHNLSGVSQVIEIRTEGGFTPVTIENNQLYRTTGAVEVRYNWREVRIDWNEEYTIWPDGVFGPQYRKYRSNGF